MFRDHLGVFGVNGCGFTSSPGPGISAHSRSGLAPWNSQGFGHDVWEWQDWRLSWGSCQDCASLLNAPLNPMECIH